jgi:hypothetical protein
MDSIAYTIPRYPKTGFLEYVEMTWLIIPKPGRIRMYTSGCPKNQKRCWYRIGSPPPAGSKKVVLKFLSVNSMVIAPARTGKDRSNKNAVINTDHAKRETWCMPMPGARILNIVVMKLMAPSIDEIPAKCKLKMAKSTAADE